MTVGLVSIEVVALLTEIILAISAVVDNITRIISLQIALLAPSAATVETLASAVCSRGIL